MNNSKTKTKYSIFLFHFIQLCRKGRVTTTAWANYCGPVLPNPPCQLSLWEENGVPAENPRLSAERWLYSFYIKMNLNGDRTRNLRGERQVVWPLHHRSPTPDHYTQKPNIPKTCQVWHCVSWPVKVVQSLQCYRHCTVQYDMDHCVTERED